jgi:hypothetical protein
MAQTREERIADLTAELAVVKAAITKAITQGSSSSCGALALTRARLDLLISERNQLERDLQRLENHTGRHVGIDMSISPYGTSAGRVLPETDTGNV